MRTRKLKKRLIAEYGRVPDETYFAGDMDYIRAYSDFMRENGRGAFQIDDITWNDLDMDAVFRRINRKRCTSGEQYLYYTLRTPALDAETYGERRGMIGLMESDGDLRLKAEMILARLGCPRRANLCTAFNPSRHGAGMLVFYLALLAFLIVSVAGTLLNVPPFDVRFILLSLLINITVHELRIRSTQQDYDTVNYSVNMVFAVRKLKKLHNPSLDAYMAAAYSSLERLRSVIHTGGITTMTDRGSPSDAFATMTLLDLISYEFLKNKLWRCYDDVFAIHEHLGRLDTAIAVASYRASLGSFAEPEIRFERSSAVSVEAAGLVHPLMTAAVPNDLITDRSVLITGSNASGKSTYLKVCAIAALTAQSICTVTAKSYSAPAFRIYSSMALSDNFFAGESYYIVETKSLKRILDASRGGFPVLCVIDEVLRGTNTIERIAASCEVLRAIAEAGAVCLAATHDVELCELMRGQFVLKHFEERVEGGGMVFDYTLREGMATTRNAINILRLMGFDDKIVENARMRAERYLETGAWQ